MARAQGILLMMCDQCALERNLATGEPRRAQVKDVAQGVTAGCFPDLYAALADAPLDQVVSL